jgi:hypothetical protein
MREIRRTFTRRITLLFGIADLTPDATDRDHGPETLIEVGKAIFNREKGTEDVDALVQQKVGGRPVEDGRTVLLEEGARDVSGSVGIRKSWMMMKRSVRWCDGYDKTNLPAAHTILLDA